MVADEGGVIAVSPVVRPQPGFAIRSAAVRKRRGMERVDHLGRAGAQANVRAVVRRQRFHIGTRIEPELGIFLTEANGRAANLQWFVADGAEHGLVEAHRARQIADSDGDVIDHAGAPDFTSLYTIESISA